MGDQVVVLDEGHIAQVGRPDIVYANNCRLSQVTMPMSPCRFA